MANWTPESFIGRLFKVLGGFVAPPVGVQSPANWGDEGWLRTAFGDTSSVIDVTPRSFAFRYKSAAHFIEIFRTWYGPVHKAFAALDAEKQRELERGIVDLVDEFNIASDGTIKVPSDYLEVVITKS